MEDNTKLSFGFLTVNEIEPNQEISGALLTTNYNGYPEELRFSEKITLTALEKIAYGVMLKSGIMIDKIALPLINELKTIPQVIFIKERNLLKIQKKISTPIVCLIQTDDEKNNFEYYREEDNNKFDILDMLSNGDLIENLTEPFTRLEDALKYIHHHGWENFDQ